MGHEIGVYFLAVIVIGGVIAVLEFTQVLDHKLTVGDFLINVLLFLVTAAIAEMVRLWAANRASGDALPQAEHEPPAGGDRAASGEQPANRESGA